MLMLLGLTILGSVAGLIGGVVFLFKESWAKTLSIYAIPFAAGVLLSVSMLHLMPETTEILGETGFFYILIAFLASFLFEKYFALMHHHEGHDGGEKKSSIPLVLFGDTIHNLIDGIAIGAAFVANPNLGLVVALSTFLHETPHEIGDFGVLISRGWSTKKAFFANFFSALATIPGAFLVYFLVPDINSDTLAIVLAVAAGVFLYLGASDFLPEIGENDTKKRTFIKALLVIAGVFVMYSLSFILPEG
ncbi:MAG: ZIP family metal transporter [Patescibacteria group bacterium]